MPIFPDAGCADRPDCGCADESCYKVRPPACGGWWGRVENGVGRMRRGGMIGAAGKLAFAVACLGLEAGCSSLPGSGGPGNTLANLVLFNSTTPPPPAPPPGKAPDQSRMSADRSAGRHIVGQGLCRSRPVECQRALSVFARRHRARLPARRRPAEHQGRRGRPCPSGTGRRAVLLHRARAHRHSP